MRRRRSWSEPVRPCVASIEKQVATMHDPLDALRLPIVPIEPRPEFAARLLRRMQSTTLSEARPTATVRYFVDDLDRAVEFYCHRLEFEEELRPGPTFAML